MKISRSVTISTSADEAWAIIGPGYALVDEWASNVYRSTTKSSAHPDVAAVPSDRVCETSLGPFEETVTEYNPERRVMSYSVKGAKMPGFVKSVIATWRIIPMGLNACEAQMDMNADLAFPFNMLTGWVIKMNFAKAVKESQEEFKYYAEHGKPHPRKIKSLQSPKGKKFAKAAA